MTEGSSYSLRGERGGAERNGLEAPGELRPGRGQVRRGLVWAEAQEGSLGCRGLRLAGLGVSAAGEDKEALASVQCPPGAARTPT